MLIEEYAQAYFSYSRSQRQGVTVAKNLSYVSFAVSMLAALQCSTAIAQATSESTAAAETAASPIGNEMGEIVVTAQRRAQPSRPPRWRFR